MSPTPSQTLERAYRDLIDPSSARRAAVVAGRVAHQSWQLEPYPVVFERAVGAEKWDTRQRRYVDLWAGHGALLLGNAHPVVVDAVARQMAAGQHVGGAHALHAAWAERIRSLVPSCEQVAFTASGTEATYLALRIARAWTGRGRIVRVDGNYHGWHDDALVHAVAPTAGGLNPGVGDSVSVVPPFDVEAIAEELDAGDVAAILLEPGGGSAGALPFAPSWLSSLRRAADSHGCLLIFDEVISGVRYAPGGAQALAGVRPDLTVMAKIAAGGMPGGLVGGRADIMEVLSGGTSAQGEPTAVVHAGTFNGFTLSAAAALATLDHAADGVAQFQADRTTANLVAGANAVAAAADVDVRFFHQSSIFHVLIGALGSGLPIGPGPAALTLPARDRSPYQELRRALLVEGVDSHASHGWVSTALDDRLVDEAVTRIGWALSRLRGIPGFQGEPVEPTAASPLLPRDADRARSR